MQTYPFDAATLPDGFFWFNEPKRYFFDQGLNLITAAKTDFWQGTHYGFRRDDGHCLLTAVTGDFALTTEVEFWPQSQYDQCGLMVRVDSQNWIKCSVEYETAVVSRLGSVVTNLGYSDWATQDISSGISAICYRLSRQGQDFLLEFALAEGQWQQMRITHLHAVGAELQIGIYACSPLGEDFHCRFRAIAIGENQWGHTV
jgi:regulation of enolase protein 1 (concanavalin A-like superfamily)